MQTKPVTGYQRPKLPTHAILEEHPELLKLVPKRWQHNPVVLAVLAGGCVLWTGCLSKAASRPTVLPGRVAPVTMRLSEEEARRIIADEAKRAGVAFSDSGGEVRVPVTFRLKPGYTAAQAKEPKTLTIKLDGAQKARRISYEYISDSDVRTWRALLPSRAVPSPAGLARTMQQAVSKAAPKEHIRLFYDPHASTMEQEREQLRAQVRDFIKWLKAQGVIRCRPNQ